MRVKIVSYLLLALFIFGATCVFAHSSSQSGIYYIFDEGYLVDENGDGIYENFHSNSGGSVSKVVRLSDGKCLLDTQGNGVWDYVYDPTTETYSLYSSNIDPAKSPADYLPWAVVAALIATITSFVVIHFFPGKEIKGMNR